MMYFFPRKDGKALLVGNKNMGGVPYLCTDMDCRSKEGRVKVGRVNGMGKADGERECMICMAATTSGPESRLGPNGRAQSFVVGGNREWVVLLLL